MKKVGGNKAVFHVFVVFFLVCLVQPGTPGLYAADLIIDGTAATLSGEQDFDTVLIINGGRLYVTPYNGTAGTGTLTLQAGDIYIDSTSAIIADGRGYRGVVNSDGEGPGGGQGGRAVYDGGGGGAYGGDGGRGIRDGAWRYGPFDGAGGLAYGSADTMEVQMGSAGGSAGTGDWDYGGYGGNGGGAIWLEADVIENAGLISATGYSGMLFRNDASGGGAGGGILLAGGTVINTGTLRANGGTGGKTCGYSPCWLDDGGGGGAGGRIKVFYGTLTDTGTIAVNGGEGSRYAEAGQNGTVYFEQVYTPVEIDIKPGSFPNSINLKAKGNVPVAVFSTDSFDASTIIPATITLAGAPVVMKNNGRYMASLEDLNGDGLLDLVVHVVKQSLELGGTDSEAELLGETSTGELVLGTDSVRIVH